MTDFRRSFLISLLMLAVLLGGATAQVGVAVETGHARTRLVAANMAAAPGETITLALVQELEDDWHVYWKNPGDSGLPLNLTWSLPGGYSAGEVAYPLPHRLPLGPLINFGHEGEPLFLVTLTVPDDAVPGATAPLSVDAEWLICRDICVPEKATLNLLLPISDQKGPATIGYADKISRALDEQPRNATFGAFYHDAPRGPVLRLEGVPEGALEFYPYTPSLIVPAATVDTASVNNETWLGFEKGYVYAERKPQNISGVLVVDGPEGRIGYRIHAAQTAAPEGAAQAFPARLHAQGAQQDRPHLIILLALSFLGGIILNAMPCVFPIVFLKAASFANAAGGEHKTVRQHGLLYMIGILSAFLLLGVLLMLARQGGAALGWGYHLQSPAWVGFFVLVIFAVGLNLAGLFEVGSSLQGLGDGLARRRGAIGAYFTGLLAVVVAAPCIGPFLGGAMGVALAQSGLISILIFLTIGLGLAAPYVLISFIPRLASFLPKPGPWMMILKQLFSFAMFGTVVWLMWVLSLQTGSEGILQVGAALVLVSFAAWIFGWGQRARAAKVQSLLALMAALLAIGMVATLSPREDKGEGTLGALSLNPVPYSPSALVEARASDHPVFVDFTAAWCVTCQFNKTTVLQTRQVSEAFQAHHVTYMVADWTLQDPEITAALEVHGRGGVPLYLYYAPGAGEPQILPALLSKSMVVSLVTQGHGGED